MDVAQVELHGEVPERRILDHEGVRILLVDAAAERQGERLGGGFRSQPGELDLDADRAQAPVRVAGSRRQVECDAGRRRRDRLRQGRPRHRSGTGSLGASSKARRRGSRPLFTAYRYGLSSLSWGGPRQAAQVL